MTRMGSSTRVAADSDYREKKHTKRCSRLRNSVDERHSRVTVTPKNKGGDADKNVYKFVILEYLTAELRTKEDEELDKHKQLFVKSNESTEVWGIEHLSFHTASSRCTVACEAESTDLSWRVGLRKDLLNS